MRFIALVPTLLVLAPAAVASAQDVEPDPQDQIVVTAQRSGAPMWTIDTPSGTIILVGEIRNVPETTPWQPDRLREATAGSQRVILGIRPKISPGDILRIIFAGGRITRLPDGTVAADYLDAQQFARLSAFEEQYDQDYSRKSFLITSYDLLSRRLRFTRDTMDDASEVVERAARRADVPTERAGEVRGEDMLDNLAEAPPETHLPCLDAAMTATEIGPDLIEQRGDDWRKYDVPAVMANPLEVALGRCWPWADEDMGGDLRAIWTDTIYEAVNAEGVTLAVVPLHLLAEQGGVLDQLVERGLDPAGPEWR
jgi:uncharacterized protein YbaP (TraB family)